jgi:hypothetical protein
MLTGNLLSIDFVVPMVRVPCGQICMPLLEMPYACSRMCGPRRPLPCIGGKTLN